MQPIQFDTIVVAAAGQVSSRVGEEAAILSIEQGIYYGLNEVGARIWELLAEPVEVRAIVEAIVDEYDVNREQCEADIRELLSQLVAAELVRVEHAAAS